MKTPDWLDDWEAEKVARENEASAAAEEERFEAHALYDRLVREDEAFDKANS